ncbi:MAG: ferrochelatase [Candidatus Midichloria mitochondrii]
MKKKIAVILFNLGGPDKLEAVKPFLFNLFNDKAIIDIAQPFRWILAKLISSNRAKTAQQNYALLGGGSPILELTQEQAAALAQSLNTSSSNRYEVFVCMRYWQPFTEEIVAQVKHGNFDEVILLPLYPQFSTTTTASSFRKWHEVARKLHLNLLTKEICCYPTNQHFIKSHVEIITQYYKEGVRYGPTRLLFSAHGLPQKIIDKGDPYEHQIKLTVKEIVEQIPYSNLDYRVCYQSKVGPLKWLKPSTEYEILQAAKDKVSILIVPISFVSEHIETLVELDIEYKEWANKHGVPGYFRAHALGINNEFIQALTNLCLEPNNEVSCFSKHKCCLRYKQKYL